MRRIATARTATATSRLSPHLHWGEISPWQVWRAAHDAASDGKVPAAEAEKFVAELGWREFSAHLLHHFPTMPDQAFRPEYDAMPWRDDGAGFEAWTRGPDRLSDRRRRDARAVGDRAACTTGCG